MSLRPAKSLAAPPLPTVDTATDAGIFDAATMMRNLSNDRALATAMLQALLDDLPAGIARLEDALRAADGETACREAHTIKGLAASGGAGLMHTVAQEMEQSCRAGHLAEARTMVSALKRRLDEATVLWRRFLDAPPDAS